MCNYGQVALLCELNGTPVEELPKRRVEPPLVERALWVSVARSYVARKKCMPLLLEVAALGPGQQLLQRQVPLGSTGGAVGGKAGGAGKMQSTIYYYIYWRPNRAHYFVHRRGYEHKTAKTLEEALEMAAQLFTCSRSDLLRAGRRLKQRPAAAERSSGSLRSSGSSGFQAPEARKDAAPEDAARKDAAPEDAAPEVAAPVVSALEGSAPAPATIHIG